MLYNIYLRAGLFNKQFEMALTRGQVTLISKAIGSKKHEIHTAGRKFELKDCQIFKTYDTSKCQNQENAGLLKDEIQKHAVIENKGKITQGLFKSLGIDVTHEFDPYEVKATVQTNVTKNMNKIFISHASNDIVYVEAFVEQVLKLGLGINTDRIFCSSMEGHGIRNGEYIPDILKEELQKTEIVFLFISQNYKTSEVCLNELGAAWALFDKSRIIPLIMPDCGFKSLGFLDQGRLGTKITDQNRMLSLVDDIKNALGLTPSISLLQKHLKKLDEIVKGEIKPSNSPQENQQPSEAERCFNMSLYPFAEVISKTIPHLSDGYHNITDKHQINLILGELSRLKYLKTYWYKFAKGDYYIEDMKLLPNGNWLFTGWEHSIPEIWVSKSSMHQYEFILIKSKGQEPYKINSDVGGEEHHIGILNDGVIVSDNERCSGYAIINNKSISLHEKEVEPRHNYSDDHWVFLATDYHKVIYNDRATEEFARKLDTGALEANETTIREFMHGLENHRVVIQNM